MKLTIILMDVYIAAISGLLGYYFAECRKLRKQIMWLNDENELLRSRRRDNVERN